GIMISTPKTKVTIFRRLPSAVAVCGVTLTLLGVALCGQGLWIYAKAALAQVLLEGAFAKTLATGRDVKPWFWADTWPVARLEVPRLNKHLVVLRGSTGQALAFAPGQLERTPDAGDRGTAVYAAHRDTHFAFLGDLQLGDQIRVRRRDGTTVQFEVFKMSIVRSDASGIDVDATDRRLVLATCWPLNGKFHGPLRYLVHARIKE